MLRNLRALGLILALAAGPVLGQAKPDPEAERLNELIKTFRRKQRDYARPAERLKVLEEIAGVDRPEAVQFLVGRARSPKQLDLLPDLLQLLSDRLPGSALVAALMEEHMSAQDPQRVLAREYLLRRAILRHDDVWLLNLYRHGTLEDRFSALRGLGRIASKSVLDAATALAHDPSWKPIPETDVNCGTIAASLAKVEGARAARLLLLLQKDPRFGARDMAAVRDATRLWSRADLRSYIEIRELAHADPAHRAATARILGKAGIEAARAPLVRLATNLREPAEVRAAAAVALGQLRIARADLAATLQRLLRDPEPAVRKAAIEGLAHLRIKQAAHVLIAELRGPLGADARAALAKLSGRPANTNWPKWIKDPKCPLPEGT